MAELSRGELLAWVNELTNLNLPKVESMGTGSAHCLIMHSIYGDVPVHKINFKAIHEYEYVHNFKVLQEAFTRHRIDRTIPVDRLIKLKFQDNLEFLQWMKKYWDAHYEEGPHKVVNVTSSVPLPAAPVVSSKFSTSKPIVGLSRTSSISSVQNQRPPAPTTIPNTTTNNNSISSTAANNTTNNAFQIAALTKTITELKLSVDEMEKERDFYFNKLRDIEILTQKINDPAITSSLFFKQVTEILYTTEDGFEIPQDPNNNTSSVMTN